MRVELQADCFAGVWGYHAKQDRNLIEPGDFESGLRAASAIGDDRPSTSRKVPYNPRLGPRLIRAARRLVAPWLRERRSEGRERSTDSRL